MVRLRPYQTSDGNYVVSWINDERSHFKWCVNHMMYPLTSDVMKAYEDAYAKEENSWILTAVDESNIPVGQLAIKKEKRNEVGHFSYIIVDDKKRKQGLGKEMLSRAIEFSCEKLNMKKITLCVFANNQIARNCYKAVGFKDKKFHERCIPFKDEIWSYYDMEFELSGN